MKKLYLFLPFFLISISLFSQEDVSTRSIKKSEQRSKGIYYKNKYAVIIGIDQYKDDKIKDLQFAVNDAKAISQLLMNKLGYDPKNVIILLDSAATRGNILDTLQKRFINDDKIEENSQLLVYFAGHGIPSKSGNKGFLLNYDAKKGSEFSTAIAMDEISRIASECKPNHILFLVDACYGGFANSRGGSNSNALIKNVWSQKSRIVMTAGDSDEEVLESSEWQHSTFVKVFLDAVERGEADTDKDNIITSKELFEYVEQRVSYYAKSKSGKQTPQSGNLTPDKGMFFIELKTGALNDIDENKELQSDEEIASKLMSKIILTSNVKTARVFVDGREIGYLTDGKLEYKLNPGFYKFDLKLEKYDPTSIETLIKPDTTIQIHLKMDSKFSAVSFNIEPADAAVILNGNVIGAGPFKTDILKGRHELIIEKRGYKPEKTIVNLLQDETTLNFKIEKITSTIELFTNPVGVDVSNNSTILGKTPLTISLDYGVHNLIFSKEDYLSQQIPIDVKESGLQRKDILMFEKPEVLVNRDFRKLRTKTIGGFITYSVLAGGSYLGYKYLDSLLIKTIADPIKYKKNDQSILKIGKYAALGFSGIFALSSTVNLIKFFTISKSKLMRKRLEEKVT